MYLVSSQEVQYSREGNKSKGEVPEKTLAVFRFVKQAFVIPTDFEKDHKVRAVQRGVPDAHSTQTGTAAVNLRL